MSAERVYQHVSDAVNVAHFKTHVYLKKGVMLLLTLQPSILQENANNSHELQNNIMFYIKFEGEYVSDF